MIRVATIKDASRLAEIQIFSKRKAFRPIFQNDDVSFNEMSVLRLALYYQDVIGALEGVGTKLMRHFLTTAKSHDVKEVYLWVLEENFAARKFYESHGYVYTGNKKEFSDSGKYLLNYALRLKATL